MSSDCVNLSHAAIPETEAAEGFWVTPLVQCDVTQATHAAAPVSQTTKSISIGDVLYFVVNRN